MTRQLQRAVLWIALLGTGCVPVRDGGDAEPLAGFRDAGRFVPIGMESLVVDRGSSWLAGSGSELAAGAKCKAVWAARDFESPVGLVGAGAASSVHVLDFEHGGAAAHFARRIRAHERAGNVVQPTSVREQPCWHITTAGNGLNEWLCVVDDRFVVQASGRDELAAALTRPGGLDAGLAAFGDQQFLPTDFMLAMFLLPRRPVDDGLSLPTPREPLVFTLSSTPRRLAMFWRAGPVDAHRDVAAQLWSNSDPEVAQRDGWQCQDCETKEQGPLRDAPGLTLMLLTFAGVRVIF